MTSIAKALGVSVVYYRDVELGRCRAFSALRINFELLAKLLGEDAQALRMAAAEDRGQLEFDFERASRAERHLALSFASSIGKKTMTKANLRHLMRILRTAG